MLEIVVIASLILLFTEKKMWPLSLSFWERKYEMKISVNLALAQYYCYCSWSRQRVVVATITLQLFSYKLECVIRVDVDVLRRFLNCLHPFGYFCENCPILFIFPMSVLIYFILNLNTVDTRARVQLAMLSLANHIQLNTKKIDIAWYSPTVPINIG